MRAHARPHQACCASCSRLAVQMQAATSAAAVMISAAGLAISCLEDAGLAKGPDYARLHNRLGLWHSDQQGYQASIDCYRKALAALEPGEELRLQANLYWNIGLGEAALIRFARLDELQKAWKATPAGQAPDKELEPFLRLQEIFQEVHRRHNLALGPKHPDTLKVLDFIQKSLS